MLEVYQHCTLYSIYLIALDIHFVYTRSNGRCHVFGQRFSSACAINQKMSILPPATEGIRISWGKGSVRPKIVTKCMKLNWSFQRDWGSSMMDVFHDGGMDIFWNSTLWGAMGSK